MNTDNEQGENPTLAVTNESESSIRRKKVRTFTSEPYPMNVPGRKRGIALIFSHARYLIHTIPARDGTEFDNDPLIPLLESFNFEVKLCQDYTKNKIFEELSEVSKMDHSKYECLAIFIMSHGRPGKVIASDEDYNVSDVWSHFTQQECPTLTGKPKLFFIQACRGKKFDAGTDIQFQGDNCKRSWPLSSLTVTDANLIDMCESMCNEVYKTPDEPDFLIAYSTILDYVSYNSPTRGSWFIQALCRIFEEHGRNYDLLTLLTFVAQQIAIACTSRSVDPRIGNKKQITCTHSTLQRPLYFFPAEIENVSEKI